MATRPQRKRRTRKHIIHAQAALLVETLLVECGHTAERFANDYGYDLVMFTHDARGYLENGHVLIQVKASEVMSGRPREGAFSLRVDARDLHEWVHEPMPVFVALFDAQRRKAYYIYVQAHFEDAPRRLLGRGAKAITVRVPEANALDLSAIEYMRAAKAAVLAQVEGVVHHHD